MNLVYKKKEYDMINSERKNNYYQNDFSPFFFFLIEVYCIAVTNQKRFSNSSFEIITFEGRNVYRDVKISGGYGDVCN
ncbi:hypothetical protein LEP1GSC124_1082 [Leptospira interrogans serovar Pyrogenes str. 200701872]|uniref:Uncharacterized protein n=1 Tax=Leptospira interrogans serovar Pyrogenes str. 200701872 TaxID=1193029 RepID=M6ZTI6_LEPIR|nr:hypothetical protein LEP1GSC124_1082 [Leptospira interrogans serovar Pyrogenes str. 200701872]